MKYFLRFRSGATFSHLVFQVAFLLSAFLSQKAALAQPDYAPAHWNPINCPKYWTDGNTAADYYGEGRPGGHYFCVIHDMEGYYVSGISYLQRCDTSGGNYNVPVSCHYVVNSDYNSDAPAGDITQLVREAYYAWHALCWNPYMFGTEHEGFASNPAWYTETMYQASAGLQRHLCDVWGIPKDRNHIIGHDEKKNASWVSWMQANFSRCNPTCNSHTDPGQYWDWNHFMALINGNVNNAQVAGSSVPGTVQPGQNFTATITMNNNGGTTWTSGANYRLGSQSPQDNTTWGFGRVALPSSVSPGQNVTFTLNATAPGTPGAYTFAWRMVQDGVEWFGGTFSTVINVVGTVQGGGIPIGSYTFDTGNFNPALSGGPWASATDCNGVGVWYWYPRNSSCAVRAAEARWNGNQSFSGRGHWHTDALIPCISSVACNVRYTELAPGGADQGTTAWIDQCAFSTWTTVLDQDITDLNTGGWRINAIDVNATCIAGCGSYSMGASLIRYYGARWHYIDDWTCVGGYGSSSVSDTANRSFTWGESGMYLYPAVDTTHGNVITAGMGLNGKTPGHVGTGDCNNANTLDFKGNANAYGGADNMDSYGFAWMYSPGGAGPKFLIGSDDGNRVWVNGNLINDKNDARGLTRDQDETPGIGLASGWNRILFKVHNFGGGFNGTVSLRNGGTRNWNEPSVNVFDLGGFYSYGVGYEQDGWYPYVDVASFYGGNNPQPGDNFYGNNTTVSASGSATVVGPVPLWKVMHYEWGNGITGDSDYADVSGVLSGSNWTHAATGVTGHRRFHFFAVSQSGRTSFQNNGVTGGSNWADGGPGNYMDVYVDNVPPQNPSFTTVAPLNLNQINLAWAIPLDQGVGTGPGSTEAADETSNSSGNFYRVGDVGVQIYRDGVVVSTWSSGEDQTNSLLDAGLSPNTAYTYTIEARDNNSAGRGSWNNSTGQQGTNTAWTLSVPPGPASITASPTNPATGNIVNWTAVNGFGPGQVQYYRYAWDQSAMHTWTDTEPQWSSGTLATTPNAAGNWYLHVKGYNGANIPNGTYDYAIAAQSSVACSQTNAIVGIAVGSSRVDLQACKLEYSIVSPK